MAGKKVTDFGREVFVDPAVNPKAAAYASGMVARAGQRGGLPKYVEPVGGPPSPSIPRLDAQVQQGRTMAEQAEESNSSAPELMAQMATQRQGSIVEPIGASGARRPVLALQPGDILPEEAQAHPAFRSGQGALFAMNQPELAARFGVIRNGVRIPPQALTAGPAGQLRPETMQGLRDLEELRAKQGLSNEKEAEKEVEEGTAGHSAKAGRPLGKGKEATAEEQKKVEEAIEAMDSFDYDSLRQAMNRDVLNNPDQREIIEARCKSLDIDDLILRNRVSQDVPVIIDANGKIRFVVRYTSMTGDDDLALKRLIMTESKSVEVNDRYLLDKFAFMSLSCGLTAINNNTVPSHLNKEGEFDETEFWKKFHWVMKRPLHMLACIGVNHTWFEMRVRKLFVAEKLGNG